MERRVYEGTTRLQEVGLCQGIQAKNIMVGDVLVWNFGRTSKVKAVSFSATGKTLTITTEIEGNEYTRRLKAETIVVVKELNPAEEVETEAVEIEEVEMVEEVVETEEEQQVEVETEAELVENDQKQQVKMSAFEKWLRTFIEEKGLNEGYIFEVEHQGTIHFVEFDFLINVIVNSSKAEKEQIKRNIVMIDFKNGDVMHFFNYLASAYVKVNY